jgi:ribosome-associated protein
MKAHPSVTLELVKKCCRALDDKKAGDLRVLDVREQSSITDYLIVATGTSEPHLRALRIEAEKILDAAGAHIVGMDGQRDSGWVVIDAFDLMLHMFLEESRQNYRLEQLWKDATEIKVADLLAEPKPVTEKPKKVPAKKKAAVKKTPAVKKTAATKKAAVKKAVVAKKVVKKKSAAKPAAKKPKSV